MAHFAKVEDGLVTKVIVAEPEFFETFIDDSPGQWIQTSYNTYGGVHYDPETGEPSEDQSKALRKNFAGIGFTYDEDADAFIEPKPFASWILNETTYKWEPPVEQPALDKTSGQVHVWNEDDQTWDAVPYDF